MNALDFLIDFATLINAPSQSKQPHETDGAFLDPRRDLEAASIQPIRSSILEQHHFVDEAPRETAADNFAANPPPQQPFFVSRWPVPHAFEYECHRNPFYPIQQNNHIWQNFNRYTQQDLHPSLPYDLVSTTPHAWSQQTQNFQPWNICSEYDYTQSHIPDMWYYPWANHIFQPTQHPDTHCLPISEQNMSSQLPCNDIVCHCQYPNTQNYYQTEDMQHTWDTPETSFTSGAFHAYNIWPPQTPSIPTPQQYH